MVTSIPNNLNNNSVATAIAAPARAGAVERPDAADAFQRDATVSGRAQVTDAVAPTNEVTDSDEAGVQRRQPDSSQTQATTRATSFSADEQRQIRELQARDREVRAHEQAHLAAAGQYAKGGIQYEFQRGPDGRLYAVGGQVNVDTSEIPGDPQATLRKAQTLRRAALAPAQPSSQDRAVAADMTAMAAEAMQDISAERSELAAARAQEAAAKAGADAYAANDPRNVATGSSLSVEV